MRKKYKIGGLILLSIAATFLLIFLFRNSNFSVLNPKGTIASQQYDLIITATLLMLVIVLPVLILTFVIAWRYREGNTKAKYKPEVAGNHTLETIWWAVPLIIIIILSGIIWKSSHDLDPFKPVVADKQPLTIQVVSLDWKWLFIYPDQQIATVNYLQIPDDTPINFKLTSNGAMNSFWIPQLGGQIYTMAGMETTLHLIATENGEYSGQSANLSGEGFAGMKFVAKSTSDTEFTQWVDNIRAVPKDLNHSEFEQLAKPSKNNEPLYFSSVERNLFNSVITKFISPEGSKDGAGHGH